MPARSNPKTKGIFMSPFEAAMSLAVQLPQAERERLAKALGVAVASAPSTPSSSRVLPMASATTRPDPVAWRKAESGHAVLATETGLSDAEIPTGPSAIAGVWQERAEQLLSPRDESTPVANGIALNQIPAGTPVLVHADLCLALACGEESATEFFNNPPVEIRLATAGYLHLLSAAQTPEELRRIRRFVQPFAVLSLGPMASSRSVELMLEHSLTTRLSPLDAFIAATALAHEIPLVTRSAAPFASISDLAVCRI
jgi:predicted nucleic acid-binding protein